MCNKRRLKTTLTVQFWLSKAEERRYGTKAKHIRAITNDFEQHNPKTHLVRRFIDAALDKLESVKIFGGDYST
jgi:hypothetical protein